MSESLMQRLTFVAFSLDKFLIQKDHTQLEYLIIEYEFVKYLRQHICTTLGSMIEEEMEKCTSDENQGEECGYDTVVQHVSKRTQESKDRIWLPGVPGILAVDLQYLQVTGYKEMLHHLKNIMIAVVESMINKFEEDEIQSQERQKKIQKEKSRSYCADNCSDSDSSFNQEPLPFGCSKTKKDAPVAGSALIEDKEN
ncbi:hypothetical protein P7K49_008535 [Saguinus oedipus]|uniref:BROMI N-terminal domain-containing protein n=1 Tax=Saguinus oedipus TaxID=9490 RepID=A0ABQ9VY04_SAGOE|nr:hypothetical protein P7K49_008535 [Saguinus oedipus]